MKKTKVMFNSQQAGPEIKHLRESKNAYTWDKQLVQTQLMTKKLGGE